MGQQFGLVVERAIQLRAELRLQMGIQPEMRSDPFRVNMRFGGHQIQVMTGAMQGIQGLWDAVINPRLEQSGIGIARSIEIECRRRIGCAERGKAVQQGRADYPFKVICIGHGQTQFTQRVLHRAGNARLWIGQRAIQIKEYCTHALPLFKERRHLRHDH